LFLDSSEHIDLKQNVFGDPGSVSGAWCGVVLLLLFLFFDSFTGQWQTRLFQINKSLSPLQMMLIMNAFSAVFSFITLIHQEEFMESLTFVYKHPEMILHLVIFCICSTVGQLFIFYTGNTAIQLTVLRLDQKLTVLLHSFYFFLIWKSYFYSEKLWRRRFLNHHVNKNFVLDASVVLRVFSSYHRARLPRNGHRIRCNYLSDKAPDGGQATHPLA
jgi:hypothetical protein